MQKQATPTDKLELAAGAAVEAVVEGTDSSYCLTDCGVADLPCKSKHSRRFQALQWRSLRRLALSFRSTRERANAQ